MRRQDNNPNKRSQEKAWDSEYLAPRLLSRDSRPHADVVRFYKWLKKKWRAESAHTGKESKCIEECTVLDLGSGTGRNALYFALLGARVIGYELSSQAIKLAKENTHEADVNIIFQEQDIGTSYPLPDASIDIILDITSSNSLSQSAREVYLSECHRVLKKDGMMLVRALCKDGDLNAKNLLTLHPGPETDTYVLPELGVIERVFAKTDFLTLYRRFFNVLLIEKVTHYPRLSERIYKRNYLVAYLQVRKE